MIQQFYFQARGPKNWKQCPRYLNIHLSNSISHQRQTGNKNPNIHRPKKTKQNALVPRGWRRAPSGSCLNDTNFGSERWKDRTPLVHRELVSTRNRTALRGPRTRWMCATLPVMDLQTVKALNWFCLYFTINTPFKYLYHRREID